MPMPQSQVPTGQVIREDLTGAISDETPWTEGLVATQVLPVMPRSKRFFEHLTFDPLQYIKQVQSKPAVNGAFTVVGMTGAKQTGNLDLYQLGAFASWNDKTELGELEAEKLATKRAYAGTALQYEIDVAAALAAALAAAGTTGETAGAALSNAAQDPLGFFQRGIYGVFGKCGKMPSGAVIPLEQFLGIVNHPLVADRLWGKGSPDQRPLIVSAEKLASLLSIPKILIAAGKKVVENAAATSDIWPSVDSYLFYNTPGMWQPDIATLGATMRLTSITPPGHTEKPAVGDGYMVTSFDQGNPPGTTVVVTAEQAGALHPFATRCGWRIAFPAM